MADFGTRLRDARERRGITLREIAARTKISIGALEALERSDASRMPGGIFARSFVRSYASEVGLDPEAVLRDFLDRFGGQPRFSVMSASPSEPGTRAFGIGRTALKLLVASLVAMGILLYLTMGRHPADQSTASPPDSGRRTSRRLMGPALPKKPGLP